MKHIDLITAKIIDGEIDVDSLSAHQKTLVIEKFYEIADSLIDGKLDNLGTEMFKILNNMRDAPEYVDDWNEHPELEESIQVAEDKGSFYLPPDDYMLQ